MTDNIPPPIFNVTPSAVQSPCVNICSIDRNSGLCEGCARSLDEIGEWASASDQRKKEILSLVDERIGSS